MKEIDDFRTWAVHGNFRKWARVLAALEALAGRIGKLLMEFRQHETQQAYEDFKLDKRITALEEKHNHKPIFDRLSALEKQAKPFDGWFENLHERINRIECPSPLLLDLVKRVCALDVGTDYEVHEKRPLSCRDCGKARWSEHFRGLGSCPEYPVLDKQSDACPNFEAIP